MSPANDHISIALDLWKKFQSFNQEQELVITGLKLDIPTVVAVSQAKCQPFITEDEATVARIHNSVRYLAEYLKKGNSVYGVTTGYGGSADSRTTQLGKLQVSLLQLTQSGVLLPSDKEYTNQLPEGRTELSSMPTAWVRATMLIRCNSIARGHSAVSMNIVQDILRLLRANITPVVPLRGSVSASGDLMPLAYIAGAIEGNPDVVVRTSDGRRILTMSAEEALSREKISKTVFGPKEALSLVNGTAASAAVASLVMYDSHHLAVLSQAITAMAVEGMMGASESFHPFIAAARPHPGQIEASRNILSLLQGSSFARDMRGPKDRNPVGLAQDRYSLRSAPQWLGPQLEDLLSAHTQVTTELNSSADNPVIDAEAGEVYYGANFQAASATAAMEKTRLALQMLGRLLFAQTSELIDPSLNNGLPANLAADDPSTSFTMKGVDINMAAYMSELGFLANPVSTHVQTAEMHNQAINSLALVAARMTHKAVEIVSLMSATSLYVGCQALDLRAMQLDFLDALETTVKELNEKYLAEHLSQDSTALLTAELKIRLAAAWRSASRLDIEDRIKSLRDEALLCLMAIWDGQTPPHTGTDALSLARSWAHGLYAAGLSTYKRVSREFFARPSTEAYLGRGALSLYRLVRQQLGVPFHQGIAEHPGTEDRIVYGEMKRPRKLIGSWISIVYEALLDGRAYGALYGLIEEIETKTIKKNEGQMNGHANGGLNGHANGDSNGHANVASNGLANGDSNGH
ncbi:hypothetical protein ACHAQH_002367 [Verticillium albo-atrum]